MENEGASVLGTRNGETALEGSNCAMPVEVDIDVDAFGEPPAGPPTGPPAGPPALDATATAGTIIGMDIGMDMDIGLLMALTGAEWTAMEGMRPWEVEKTKG